MDIPVISEDVYIKDIDFERVREELYDVAAELGSSCYFSRTIRYIVELEEYVKQLEGGLNENSL